MLPSSFVYDCPIFFLQKGKIQHYEFGRWMRDRYSKLLPEQYHRSDIYVQSTDVDRTLMSVESHLAGLYPPVTSQIWNQNLSWQPIPIHTVPESMDYVSINSLRALPYTFHFANFSLLDSSFDKTSFITSFSIIHIRQLHSELRIDASNSFNCS